MTFDYSALWYDEGFSSDSAESVYAYTGRLAPQPIVAVSRRSYHDSFVPTQVMVNGAKDRRVGCLIAEDKIRYIVFDLDHDEDEAADDESMDLDP
jgi:anaphase-promoting complex subunit 4